MTSFYDVFLVRGGGGDEHSRVIEIFVTHISQADSETAHMRRKYFLGGVRK